jgi:signal transduction histidine kinase
MNALYIMIYLGPFALLRYYPFRDRLRLSVKKLILLYAVLLSIQAAIYCFLSLQPFWTIDLTQTYRMGFVVFFALLSFTLVKEKLSKQFYIWSLIFVFASVVMGNSNFIEARFFAELAWSFPHAVANLVEALQILIFFPLAIKLIDRWIVPAIHSTDSPVWYTVGLIPALLYIPAFMATGSLEFHEVSSLSYLLIRYFTFLSMLLISIVLFESLKKTAENARLLENTRMTEQLLAMGREHYNRLAGHIEEAKRARHDLRHHLSVIQAYLEHENKEKLKEYVDQYQLTLPLESTILWCHNYTVNVIMQYYLDLAQIAGIDVDIQLALPKKTKIADADLCVIFGNLLENALEACQKQSSSRRYITIRADQVRDNVVITVDNSYEGDILKVDEVFLSSKHEGTGIGVTSVQAVAKRYDGIANFECMKNIFKASIMLQVPQMKHPTKQLVKITPSS